MLAISSRLETRIWPCVTYVLVSIAPASAVVFDLSNHMEPGLKSTAVGVVVLATVLMVIFVVCGKSLVHAIDQSLLQQQQQLIERDRSVVSETSAASMAQGSKPHHRCIVCENLFAARRKVKMVVIFAVITLVNVVGILMFALLSKYGMAAPLVLFFAPMTLIPPVWIGFHTEVHANRTKLRCELSQHSAQSSAQSNMNMRRDFPKLWYWSCHAHQDKVIPTAVTTGESREDVRN